jgi:hypothetical protein
MTTSALPVPIRGIFLRADFLLFSKSTKVSPEILCESILLRAFGGALRRSQEEYRPKSPAWLIEFRNALEAQAHEPVKIEDVIEQIDVHPIHTPDVQKILQVHTR